MDVDDDLLRDVVRQTQTAISRLDGHEVLCNERTRNIWQAITKMEDVFRNQANDLKSIIMAQNTDVHGRLNVISNRMFIIMFSTIGGLVGALLSLVGYLLFKGKL